MTNFKKISLHLYVIGITALLLFINFSPAQAINLETRTITQSVGKGINNGTNKNLDRSLLDCGFFGAACFPNTDNPFQDPPVVSSENPASFASPNTGLGMGVPCGPDDTNGPVFPYPCSSEMTISNNMSVFMNSPGNQSIIIEGPSLGTSGGFFQKFTQTPVGDGTKIIRIEGGFDKTIAGCVDRTLPNCAVASLSIPSTVFKFFYSLDTNIDADGKMIGIASGSFEMIALDNFFPDGWEETGAIPPGSPGSSGTFTADETGGLTCLNNDGSPCLSFSSPF